AEEEPAGGDHDARTPDVGEPPGGEAEDAVAERVERERAGETRAAPAELLEEGAEEDAERVLRAVGDEEDEERAPDDDPAVEDSQRVDPRPFGGGVRPDGELAILAVELREDLREELAGVRAGRLGHRLRRPLGDDLAALLTALRPEVDEVVRRLDDVEV